MVNQHTIKRPVRFCECGDHAWLILTRGSTTLIDPGDAAWAGAWSWTALVRGVKRCAVRRENRGRFIYLHREIMKTPDGMVVDHKNGDQLDNRRRNLRNCLEQKNHINVLPQRKDTSSRFKGVYRDKARGQWQAYINVDGKRYRLGRFQTDIEAAEAYDAKALELHGEFARTNRSLGLLPTRHEAS